MELATLRALEREPFGHLQDNVLAALRHFAGHFVRTVLRDPANLENVVSNDLTETEKEKVANAARDAVHDENWQKILW